MSASSDRLDHSVELALSAIHALGRPLKLLYGRGLVYFVFGDDWPAKQCRPENLFNSLTEFLATAAQRQLAPPGSSQFSSEKDLNVYRTMFSTSAETRYIDVGANYGRETIRAALFRRALELPARRDHPSALAFEPCPVRHVAALNLDLHDVPEVRLLPYAIGAADGYAPISFGVENTLGGSLVATPRGVLQELLVKVVSLDGILHRHNIDAPLFMKVDAQGAEPLILAGMKNYLKEHPVCGVFEFAPGLMRKAASPREFLAGLTETFRIFDRGFDGSKHRPVQLDDVPTFVDEVMRTEVRFTDLLLLDKRLDL